MCTPCRQPCLLCTVHTHIQRLPCTPTPTLKDSRAHPHLQRLQYTPTFNFYRAPPHRTTGVHTHIQRLLCTPLFNVYRVHPHITTSVHTHTHIQSLLCTPTFNVHHAHAHSCTVRTTPARVCHRWLFQAAHLFAHCVLNYIYRAHPHSTFTVHTHIYHSQCTATVGVA